MCNLNIVIKTNVLKENICNLIPAFLTGVTNTSYKSNNDGDGIFTDNNGEITKSKNKIDIYKLSNNVIKSNMIITHQRLSTSGRHHYYTQPFEKSDFILAHNGVISQLADTKKSDTYVLFERFIKRFNKNTGTRENRILNSIKHILKDIYGSYSIVLFDKQKDNLYYFKNTSTNIHFYNNHNMLYITTNSCNKEFLKIFDIPFTNVTIKDNTIYKINILDNVIHINNIESLHKEDKYIQTKLNNVCRETYSGDLFSFDDKKPCQYCRCPTKTVSRTSWKPTCRLCEDDLNCAPYWDL